MTKLSTIGAFANLVTGERLNEQLNNITRDYESTIRRMSALRGRLSNNRIVTYRVFRQTLSSGEIVTVDIVGNTIIILAGASLELAFNGSDEFFPWDYGDPIDDFPFYQYKVKNTGASSQDVIILTLIRGQT